MAEHRYIPTLGMLAALAGHDRATEFDVERCRRRGLLDHRNEPTEAGRQVIRRQTQRLQDCGHG